MTDFHPEEEHRVWVLIGYARDHPGTCYRVEFGDGESYVCRLETSYDSDNAGEIKIEMDHPRYGEFHEVSMQILRTIHLGLRHEPRVAELGRPRLAGTDHRYRHRGLPRRRRVGRSTKAADQRTPAGWPQRPVRRTLWPNSVPC